MTIGLVLGHGAEDWPMADRRSCDVR